jgi:hypothetical protein
MRCTQTCYGVPSAVVVQSISAVSAAGVMKQFVSVHLFGTFEGLGIVNNKEKVFELLAYETVFV